MSTRTRSRTSARRTRRFILTGALAAVIATLIGVLGFLSSAASSSPSPSTGRTFFDDGPAVAHLDPELLAALRRAARDASDDGVDMVVNSGWRSRRDQEQLFRKAVSTYGRTEAARWVAVPGTSAHEAGDAVDLGPSAATAWLTGHGATYGLCQIYRNEPWHYELRPDAVDHGCPASYADPTSDPRMRR